MGIPLFPSIQLEPSLSLSLSLCLSHSRANTHVTADPSPYSPMPCLSCAICQEGRESTGGSFILALLTPCGEWCSWRPKDLWVCVYLCVRVWTGTKEKPHSSLQPHIHGALPRVTLGVWSNPPRAPSQMEMFEERAPTYQTFTLPSCSGPLCHTLSFMGGNLEARESWKTWRKLPGQFECSVLVALPWLDPEPGIYPCCKYHKALLVKINRHPQSEEMLATVC